MQSKNQLSGLRLSSLGLCLAALPALAGGPAGLDIVPTDSDAVVVVPNLGEFLADINGINGMLGEHGEPMVMFMTSMIRGMPGLDLDGSMIGVLDIHEDGGDGVVLVPITDYDAFTEVMPKKDGLAMMSMGEDPAYVRQVSKGYAAMGQTPEQVLGYDATAGQMAGNQALIGKLGSRLSSSNDVYMYMNVGAFEEMIEQGREEMETQAEMVSAMAGEEAAAGFDAMLDMFETIVNDSQAIGFGMNFDAKAGLSFDMGTQFAEGSSSAKNLMNDGDAGKYFSKVPPMDYFFASSFDMSGSGIQRMMDSYIEMTNKLNAANPMMSGFDISKFVKGINGGIQVIGAPDNPMGGLFANSLYYMESDDPEAYIGAVRDMFGELNAGGSMDTGGMVNALVSEELVDVEGSAAYGYSIGMDMTNLDNMAGAFGGPSPTMIMGMMFGESGLNGYMVPTKNGLVSTMTKDPAFLKSAVDAAKGGASLADNEMMAMTSAMLPENRVFEGYLGADYIVNSVGPMLMMFGILPEFEPMDSLAPIGMGMSADGGGLLFRTVIPRGAADAIIEFIPAEMFEGDEGYEDEDVSF